MLRERKWKLRGWMIPYIGFFSIQNPKEIKATMTSNNITYMGERLKVELDFLVRLKEAGELKREDGVCGATAKTKSLRSKRV